MADFFILIRARLLYRQELRHEYGTSNDVTVLVPLWGNISYLRNAEHLHGLGVPVVICTSDGEAASFLADVARVASERGFVVHAMPAERMPARASVNPWYLFESALTTPGLVRSTYVVMLDGDTESTEDIRLVTGEMRDRDLDVASTRILPRNRKRFVERLQLLEYGNAMEGRMLFPWLTSGAALCGRRVVLTELLREHTKFFQGGDIEIGLRAKLAGVHIGHLSKEFLTDVPSTWRGLLRQRVQWAGGEFRNSIVNAPATFRASPWQFLYSTGIVFGLLPFRMFELISNPILVLLVVLLYMVVLAIAFWSDLSLPMLVFPIWAYVGATWVLGCSALMYVRHAARAENFGTISWRSGRRSVVEDHDELTIHRDAEPSVGVPQLQEA